MKYLRCVNNFDLRKIGQFHNLRQKLQEISVVSELYRKHGVPERWR